jgi:hypothetical protein
MIINQFFSPGVLDDDVIHLTVGDEKLIFPFNKNDTVGEFIDMLEGETKVDCRLVNEGLHTIYLCYNNME